MNRQRKSRDYLPTNLLTDVFNLPFAQSDVDFVIPNLSGDIRIGIDPFLLFKSRDSQYQSAHDRLLAVFNKSIKEYAAGRYSTASKILNFPEVNEIGFGYRKTSSHGSGLGKYLNTLLLRTLGESPALVTRGVRHVEEMQLVTLGINADRVSDITANILKYFLIEYTQRQAEIYGIPITKGLPVSHIFDFNIWDWRDGYFDLPANPLDPKNRAILLVPRRIVRLLPWINYDDYKSIEFGMFLKPRQNRRSSSDSERSKPGITKLEIVEITKREVERIDHYVDVKESSYRDADPELLVTATTEFRAECDIMIDRLRELSTGHQDAYKYQDFMFSVLNRLFQPDLIEGRKQVRTEHGTEIRDLIYTNDSDKPFWDFIRNKHGSISVIFECKNTAKIIIRDIDQLAGYLGDPLGYFGIMLTRSVLPEERWLKCLAWYNKGTPHRVIIALSDDDIVRMLQIRSAGKDPTEIIRLRYQDFMAKIQ